MACLITMHSTQLPRSTYGGLYCTCAVSPSLRAIGHRDGFAVGATEDPRAFSDTSLRRFRAVAFLLTTGTVLDADQRGALERFSQRGGGWLGVHSASDTEYAWSFYGRLVGAYFRRHPAIQAATVDVIDRRNPATASLPSVWRRVDEWYDVRNNPRGRVHVLATVDERGYRGGRMGADHPIAWCHEDLGGARSTRRWAIRSRRTASRCSWRTCAGRWTISSAVAPPAAERYGESRGLRLDWALSHTLTSAFLLRRRIIP